MRRTQTGAHLVEVLITLILSSVGLLGVTALQLVTLKESRTAQLRADAVAIAVSMLDRIRSNTHAFEMHEYDAVEFNAVGRPGTRSGEDLSFWQSEIDRRLPGGPIEAAGSIHRMAGSRVITVTIRWGMPKTYSDHIQVQTEI